MKTETPCVLTINGGSSSIKFALYQIANPPRRLLFGKIDRIGLPGASLTFNDTTQQQHGRLSLKSRNHASGADFLIKWLGARSTSLSIRAVGHRVVHGMEHIAPELVTSRLLGELRRICPYDPEHLPRELELIKAFARRQPKLPQVACFDTAFHHSMPRVARLLPIPRRFEAMGIKRYGFHGLSYSYLIKELARVAGARTARGRVILAHLGNGASMAAVRGGRSIDTSMGFTPTAGFPMSTRSGDLDPGLAWHLARTEHMTPNQFYQMVNHESGLMGVSALSPDMRDLLSKQSKDKRAADAVALFCYQAKKWLCGFAGALGGLDTLVFSGGIGENAPEIRAGICSGLELFGIQLDKTKNKSCAAIISTSNSPVTVRVIRTDEEIVIANVLCRFLKSGKRTLKFEN